MSRKSRAEADAAMEAASPDATATDATPPKRGPGRPPKARVDTAVAVEQAIAAAPAAFAPPGAADVPLDQLCPSPLNPRRAIDAAELGPLADSIAANGILQPLLVRPASDAATAAWTAAGHLAASYEIICGARRDAAAWLAQSEGKLPADFTVPVRIRECGDGDLVLLAATENLARADMHPLDEAAVFAAMRPHVRAAEGQTTEAAIGRALGVSERTVFRRLALTKLAPEIETALREKEISLGQAQAFALGHHNDQRKHLKEIRQHDWAAGTERIRNSMLQARIPVDRAIFEPALYQGEIIRDEESGHAWFADPTEFARLQEIALKEKADELGKAHHWVEIVRGGWEAMQPYRTYGVNPKDKESGAVIHLTTALVMEIHAPALRMAVVNQREKAREAADRAKRGAPEPQDKSLLTAAQVAEIHAAKTRALRRAVAGDNRAALAVTCLGWLGESDVRGMRIEQWQDKQNPIQSDAKERNAIQHLLETAALHLSQPERPEKGEWPDFGHYDPDKRAYSAAWLDALLSLSDEDLAELHRRLLAERIGSWVDHRGPQYGSSWLGDSDFAVALAHKLDADRHLAATWSPDSEFFKAYSRDRLVAIARDQLHIANADKFKKGELVTLLMEQPKTFWRPELFPEVRFQSNADALKALSGPLPQPPDLLSQAAE